MADGPESTLQFLNTVCMEHGSQGARADITSHPLCSKTSTGTELCAWKELAGTRHRKRHEAVPTLASGLVTLLEEKREGNGDVDLPFLFLFSLFLYV